MIREGKWVLAAAIFVSALALGSVHTPVIAVVVILLLAAVACLWWRGEPLRARHAASLVFWVGVALTAYTLLQVLPLHDSILARIDPLAADIWRRCLLPLREEGPVYSAISVDPTATKIQVLRGTAYLLAFAAAARVASSQRGTAFLEATITVTALVLALAAWVHPVLDADKVFGLYRPELYPGARHMAPIINSNVLSGYLNIGLCLLVAQLMASRPRLPRAVVASLVVFLILTQFWIASRGGLLSMAFGLALVFVMTWVANGKRLSMSSLRAAVGVLTLGAFATALFSFTSQVWQEVATLETSKLDLAVQALRVVRGFPVFGAGRGSFESIFPAFRTGAEYVVFTHPENIIAQWATEWGPAVAVAAFSVLGLALRPRTALARAIPPIGAWASLAAVGLHNLVDFSSEFPGLVIALAVCAAIVTGGFRAEKDHVGGSWGDHPKRLVVAAGVAALGALVLVALDWGHDLHSDRKALQSLALGGTPPKVFRSAVRAASLRHPAEPYFAFLGAIYASRAHESVMPWIERTLERALVHGPAHLLLARSLARVSQSQARLEYRTAVEQAPELIFEVERDVPGLIHSYSDALELVPSGDARAGWIDIVGNIVRPYLPASSARLDADALAINDHASSPLIRAAENASRDVANPEDSPWCTGARRADCIASAIASALAVQRAFPEKCDGFSLEANVLLAVGETDKAIGKLSGAATRLSQERGRCLRALVELATRAQSESTIASTLSELGRIGCGDDAECADTQRYISAQEAARGHWRGALAALQLARLHAPNDESLLKQIAELSSRLQQHSDAVDAYEQLARRHPDQPAWREAAERERQVVLQRPPPL